jgi:PAS domain S-box-containing protein
VLLERLAVRDGRLRSTVALTATLGVLSFVVFAAVLASLNRSTRRRMVAEDAANQSAEQLRVTLQSIGDAVIATDLGGRIVFMNPIAQSLTGWRERDAVGTPLFEVFRIVNEFTRETVESPVTKVLREGTIVGLANHTLLIARDGSERPIDDSGAPIRDAQGQLIGVVLVFRDVTARRLTEQSRERLLRAEAERSTAESANRAKDQFLAVVSHELRAPLTAALSWVDLLEAGVLKEGDRTRALATIGRNLRLQSTLISDLLDVSRIAAGKLTIERVPVDVAALVQSAVESFGAEAATKKMALRFDSSGPLIALADPGRIEQIVANLVSNAIRFTPESGTVHVALAAGAGELQISVRDTGTGIAPEFLPRVFDRFTQAENPTVRGHGGLGLGLSIAKHLVELHGGTIRAESDGDGLGATFTVTLPVHDGPSAPPERPATDPAQPLTNVLILLVEDHEDTREALAFRLRARGARVAAAGSVAEGLQLYRSQRPALLISDVALPGENGFTLIRQVREAEAAAGIHTPAIAVSGFVSGEDRREALGAGFDDHVGKPIDFAALLERVRTLLARD